MTDLHYRRISDHRCDTYDLVVAECLDGTATRVISRTDVAVGHRQDVWPLIVAALTGDTSMLRSAGRRLEQPNIELSRPSTEPEDCIAPITRVAMNSDGSGCLTIKVTCPHCSRRSTPGGRYGHRVVDCEHPAGYEIADPNGLVTRTIDLAQAS